MHPFIKFIFTILGGILIGFGLGIMAHKNSILSAAQFEVAIVMSLIAGGFFLALGIPGKKTQPDDERETPGNPNPQA
jgi:NADH:ubiquinone oxidoreductase subunit 6 (subunit J)